MALSALVLGGCMVGPDYAPPTADVPDLWRQTAAAEITDANMPLQGWWGHLNDPQLGELMVRAREGNLTLVEAYERIEEARALRGVAAGAYWPRIDGVGSYERSRASNNAVDLPAGTSMRETNLNVVGFDSSWELDAFGRIARSVEAAEASLAASTEAYRDVLVTLYAEVALNYVEARTFQERISFAQENIESQQQTLQLTRDRREAEIAPELDVAQAELNLANTEAEIPPLRAGYDAAVNRLAVLLGEHPGSLQQDFGAGLGIPAPAAEVAVGIPAEMVRRRPDIRQRERELAAQTARVGVATAELYPAFSLSGTFTFQANAFENMFDRSSIAWGLGPAFRWNLFDGDRVRSNIAAEDARVRQAAARYQNTILTALAEVENSLIDYTQQRQRREALTRAVEAAQRSVELVGVLYISGLTDFQNVLDAQRTLFQLQDQLAVSRGTVVLDLISVYKALGGGWQSDGAAD